MILIIKKKVNFCLEDLQELLMDWEAISNTWKSILYDFQTPWSWVKKKRMDMPCFLHQPPYLGLEFRWNPLPCVRFITSRSNWDLKRLDLWRKNPEKKILSAGQKSKTSYSTRGLNPHRCRVWIWRWPKQVENGDFIRLTFLAKACSSVT